MQHLNFEFKAKANDINALEQKLLLLNPLFIGEDHQIDTYFNVAEGRLKLREGTIEHSLIFYQRDDVGTAKQSKVILYNHTPNQSLKQILQQVHGIKIVVDKKRKIYFIDNVKFHFDRVEGLGTFVEVEAIDKVGDIGIDKLIEQCNYYQDYFGIQKDDILPNSYSDMLL